MPHEKELSQQVMSLHLGIPPGNQSELEPVKICRKSQMLSQSCSELEVVPQQTEAML
jgi:hypothetical protein